MAETDIQTEVPAKRSFKDSVTAKRSRLVFFVLNLALVVPYLVQNYSHAGLIATFLLMVIGFCAFVLGRKDTVPAARDVPVLLFLNILAFIAVSHRAILDHFDAEDMEYVLENMHSEAVFPIIVSLAVSFFIRKKEKLLWVRCLCKTVAGAALIVLLLPTGENPLVEACDGNTMLGFYLLFAVVWFTFCMFSAMTDSKAAKRNVRLTNWLLVLLVLYCTVGVSDARVVLPQIKEYLLGIARGGLAWWKVILSAVGLAGCAIVVYDHDEDSMGPDALLLCIVAGAMVILRVLLDNFFNFSWAVFGVFLLSAYTCFRNELNNKTTLRLENQWYAAVQVGALLIAIWLLKAGLWVMLGAIALYTLIFYTTVGKGAHRTHPVRHWLTVLSAPTVIALAFIAHRRFSPGAMGIVLVSFAVFAGVLLILSLPHPDKMVVPRTYRVLLCALLSALCLLTMTRHGAKVEVEFQPETGSAQVEIEARGKDNAVQSVTYVWSDKTGRVVAKAEDMELTGGSIPIVGEVLTVQVTDAMGVVTTRKAWYPSWLLEQ